MKKQVIVICVSCAALLLPNIASASTWELLDQLQGSKLFIDRSSLGDVSPGKKDTARRIRTLISYDTVQTNVKGVKFLSMSFVDAFSCASRTRTTLSSVQYAGRIGKGAVVNSHRMDRLIPTSISGGSEDEFILAELNCNLMTAKWGN